MTAETPDGGATGAPDDPGEVRTWIGDLTGAAEVALLRRPGGGRHQAWDVHLTSSRGTTTLFLKADAAEPPAHERYTIRREAEIYRALAPTAVPVPEVVGVHPTLPAVLMARVEGAARFAGLDTAVQRGLVDQLAAILADLHDLDVEAMDLPSLLPARPVGRAVLDELREWESRLGTTTPQPFYRACFRWLRDHVPAAPEPASLVQGDTGPGNFLHLDGKITAILDWELAHLGDPIEDLAWVATRNSQEPVPDFAAFIRAYETRRGPVPRQRLQYHMVFAELRIAVLATERTSGRRDLRGEVGNGLIYGSLHKRLTVEAVAAALGKTLDPLGLPEEEATPESELFDAILVQLRDIVVPALTDPFAAGRAKGLARIVKYLQGVDRYRDAHRRAESADWERILGAPVTSLDEARRQAEQMVLDGKLNAEDLLPLAWNSVRREHQAMGSAMGVLRDRHLPDLQSQR